MSELWVYIKNSMLEYPKSMVRNGSKVYTYLEIINMAEERATRLTALKYAILCKDELNAAIWVLAVIAAGKTAVPLSERYGENHYKRIIKEVRPNYIISEDEIMECNSEIDQYDKENLYDVAFIMCTSGTTGVPKGAMITRENIITNISDISKYFGINEGDDILISRPIYHCAVLTGEFLVSLINGVSIHFINEGFNPPRIIDYIYKHNIKVFCNTPSGFYYICKFAKDNKLLSSLRKVVVSGECMTIKSSELMKERLVNAEIFNVYGLTEASPRVSYLRPGLFNGNSLSVGQPLCSVNIKVVNDKDEEVLPSVEGELLVKGNSVMKGYYRNEEKTNSIIKDGWLHTGDIAVIDKENLLYIKSRKDDMIIKGGMNIYPQEIEEVLLRDKRIIEVLVYGVHNEYGQKISADIVTNTPVTKNDIIKHCANELVPYQIPDEINFVDALQKNASGKKIRMHRDI